jgi:hypothetical protein
MRKYTVRFGDGSRSEMTEAEIRAICFLWANLKKLKIPMRK